MARVKPEHDDKLTTLIRLLKTDPDLRQQKVIIFTEFADTARYLEQELTGAGIAAEPGRGGASRGRPPGAGRLRKQAEKDLTNEHLKPLQAPPGVAPVLRCWMELS